jgi:hypothetical protein
MSNRSGRNAIAIAALICGTLVACMALYKNASVVEVVALVGVFTTIAGAVVKLES